MSELTNIENGKVKLSLKIPAEDYRRALEVRTAGPVHITTFPVSARAKCPARLLKQPTA